MAGSDVSLYFNMVAKDRATPVIQRSAAAVRAANAAAAASAVAMGAAMASAGAYAIALGSAVSGSIGLIPSIAAGAAAAIVGLKMATSGLGTAWKAMGQASASGGGSAASTARQVAAAQREVTSASEALSRANKQLAAAQQAVNDSQEIAVKNLRDLNLNLADAQLSEQAAVLGLADARQALAQARMSGDSSQIAHATLGYKEAQLAILQARARTDDLTEAQQKATAAGIQGSEAVTSAQEQYLTATQAVADATQRLADAQANLKSAGAGGGGGGGPSAAAIAMAKLAPSAREVVLALKAMGPAWTRVQQSVQQATFAGVAGDLRTLSAAVLPSVTTQLTKMGQGFNRAIRSTLGLAASKKSVGELDTILTATNQAVDRIGRAMAPFLDGFLTLGAAGAGFLPQMAGWVGTLADKFQAWANSAQQTGKLATWLNNARNALDSLWHIAGNVAASIAAVFRAGGGGDGATMLQRIEAGTAAMARFLNSAQGQQQINTVLSDLRDILAGIGDLLPAVAGHAGEFTDTLKVSAPIMHELAQHADLIAKVLPLIAAGYLASKAAGLVDLGVQLARLPVMGLHTVAMRGLTREMKAARLAQLQANAAMVEGDVIQKRSVISMIASKIATVAQAVATGIATAAQWLWNIAQMANPTTLIIIAIIALIAIFVLLWVKCSWFRDFWIGLWHIIADAALWVWHNVLEPYFRFVIAAYSTAWSVLKAFGEFWWDVWINKVGGAIMKVGGVFKSVFQSIGGWIAGAFKDAVSIAKSSINGLISLLNRAVGFINSNVVDNANKVPGVNFPHLPTIPQLASGGLIARAGLALVGEQGPEVVSLPQGAQVHRTGTGPGGGPVKVEITIKSDGSMAAFMDRLRYEVRSQGGELAVLGLKAA